MRKFLVSDCYFLCLSRRCFFLSVSYFVALLLVYMVGTCEAIHVSVDLHSNQKKCFGEQLGHNVLLKAKFKADGPLQAWVTSPTTTAFQGKNKNELETAFTTESGGTHMFCIHNLNRNTLLVEITIVWGPEARDYSQIAKRQHLDDVVVLLRRVEDQLTLHHNIVLYMKDTESKMRVTSDSTAFRVMGFCALSICVLVLLGLVQSIYFRRFFMSKKII